jgi:hypothetical protein
MRPSSPEQSFHPEEVSAKEPDHGGVLSKKLTRRQFLIGAGAAAAGAGLTAASREAAKLAEKGITVGHLANVLRHIIADPDLLPAYQKAREGVKRGEVVPDLNTMEQGVSVTGRCRLVDVQIPKWSSASSPEGESFPIKSHAVVVPAAELRGSFGKKPRGEISVPISEAIPPEEFVEPSGPGGYGHGSGIVAASKEGGVEVVAGDRQRIEEIRREGGEIHQVPFALSAGEELPPSIGRDTYLWCVVGVNDEVLVVHNVEPGVRVSVENQRKMVDRIFEGQGLGEPQHYLLTSKGSSSGIGFAGVNKGYLGHPLVMARGQSYLNIE